MYLNVLFVEISVATAVGDFAVAVPPVSGDGGRPFGLRYTPAVTYGTDRHNQRYTNNHMLVGELRGNWNRMFVDNTNNLVGRHCSLLQIVSILLSNTHRVQT